MSRIWIAVMAAALFTLVQAAGGQEAAQTEATVDSIMGDYVGMCQMADGKHVHARAKVIAEGDGKYRAVLTAEASPPLRLELNRDLEAEGVALKGYSGSIEWKGIIVDSLLIAAKGENEVAFGLLRIEHHSPTAGLAPPDGAIVLLPFNEGQKTTLDAWQNKNWKLLPDGSAQVFKGGNRTIREHGSGIFHLEFKCPYEPKGRGQGRGNSGVYFASRYEIQILDSFGLEPGMGDCGSFYGIAITKENACLPPLSWQTYDVIYRAPHPNAEGGFDPGKMTVFHNGVKIHENQPFSKTTTAAPEGKNAARGPLFLQDHGHPVCYRNIWYLELPD